MQTYIVLGRLLPSANRDRETSIEARNRIWAEFQKKGMRFRAFNTLGPFDIVTIVESPSEELAMKFFTTAWGTGDIETTTLRAYSDEELDSFRKG